MKYLVALLLLTLLPSCRSRAEGQGKEVESDQRSARSMTEELEQKNLELGSPVFLRAFKEERELELFVQNKKTGKFLLFRKYPIVAASGGLGPKQVEGDNQVPEGFYHVPPAAMKPDSKYHLAFNIGYPNAYDTAHSRTGSYIMVHGSNVSSGCLAMTDAKIEEIYSLCQAAHQAGQPFFRIHIFPFRMTDARMTQAAGSKWLPFWRNLKIGYDLFEKHEVPPAVNVQEKKYVFE